MTPPLTPERIAEIRAAIAESVRREILGTPIRNDVLTALLDERERLTARVAAVEADSKALVERNATLERMRVAGSQMSNLCYNLQQSDEIPPRHRESMHLLRQAWDTASPPPSSGEVCPRRHRRVCRRTVDHGGNHRLRERTQPMSAASTCGTCGHALIDGECGGLSQRDDRACPWCVAETARLFGVDDEGRAGDAGEGHYLDCPHFAAAPSPSEPPQCPICERTTCLHLDIIQTFKSAPPPMPTSNRFRKKPVVIDAFQWLPHGPDGGGDGWGSLDAWLVSLGYPSMDDATDEDDSSAMWINADLVSLTIPTLEGEMRVAPNDWIIRGVKGEFYPCKPDVFAITYEPADASQ